MKTILTAALLLLGSSAFAADPAVDKILQCMRANIPPTVRIQQFELTSVDRTGGSRTLRGRLYATREGELARVMLQIEAPTDLAGAAYLVREGAGAGDEMFAYLPSLGKVRRLTGASGDRSLLGTDFSYSDFKLLTNAFVGSAVRLETSTDVVQRQAYRLSFTPLPGGTSAYSFVRTWVDQETCVPLKAHFYVGDTVRKRFTAPLSALQQAGNYWYLSEVVMIDVLAGTKTVMRTSQIAGEEKMSGRYFDPEVFYLSN